MRERGLWLGDNYIHDLYFSQFGEIICVENTKYHTSTGTYGGIMPDTCYEFGRSSSYCIDFLKENVLEKPHLKRYRKKARNTKRKIEFVEEKNSRLSKRLYAYNLYIDVCDWKDILEKEEKVQERFYRNQAANMCLSEVCSDKYIVAHIMNYL